MKSYHSHSKIGTEQGTVMVIFSVFMLAMVPLLALSIDTYFMVQGRLEEQNLAEYAALTSLDGYIIGSATGSNPTEANENGQTRALLHLKSIEGDNKITGLAEGSGWNFTQTSCSSTACSGSGWTLEFGILNQDTGEFTPAPDPLLINATRFSMELPDNSFYSLMRTQMNTSSGEGFSQSNNIKLPVSSVSYLFVDGDGEKHFRLYRNMASGVDDNSAGESLEINHT